ncbi:MAG: hypothetical protein ACE14V_15370 [bacterium]
MNERIKTEILDIFSKLANSELLFFELYSVCSKYWIQDAQFWLNIAQDEQHHVTYVNQMRELINQFPEQFSQEKPFNPISLISAGQMAKIVIQKINSSQINQEEILNIAFDIEKSILECNYDTMLQTQNERYLQLAHQLVVESNMHKEMIEQQIKKTRIARKTT